MISTNVALSRATSYFEELEVLTNLVFIVHLSRVSDFHFRPTSCTIPVFQYVIQNDKIILYLIMRKNDSIMIGKEMHDIKKNSS